MFVIRRQDADTWTSDEVGAWLEREGLGALSLIVKEQGLDGSILLALHTEAKKENGTYKDDTAGLGISDLPLQLKLKGKLVALFG